MKLVILCTLVACALAAPQSGPQADVQLLRYENENEGNNDYRFAYELSDGTKREEQGTLKNAGTDEEALSVTGSYSWVDPQGQTWTITFLADENGFQPKITSGSAGGGGGLNSAVVASLLG